MKLAQQRRHRRTQLGRLLLQVQETHNWQVLVQVRALGCHTRQGQLRQQRSCQTQVQQQENHRSLLWLPQTQQELLAHRKYLEQKRHQQLHNCQRGQQLGQVLERVQGQLHHS